MGRAHEKELQGAAKSQTPKREVRCLRVLHSSDASIVGRMLAIGDSLTIGRVAEDGVALEIDDRLLSRRHATISRLGTSAIYEFVDHDSRNGSFVDGRRVPRAHISDGAIVRLGVTVFELNIGDPEEPDRNESIGTSRETLIGRNAQFTQALRSLEDAAGSDDPVALVGETGSGKTMAATYLHRLSKRSGPFLAVSCQASRNPLTAATLLGGIDPDDDESGVKEGFLDSCRHGTLMLNEIDLLSIDVQRLLLEVVRTKKYRPLGATEDLPLKTRLVFASGANLPAAVAAGALNLELYQSARQTVELPPLRARRADIPLLARHFLKLEEPHRDFTWSASFLEKLLLYEWPLNIREIRTIMRRLTMADDSTDVLRTAHLPVEIRQRQGPQSEDTMRASAVTVHAVPSRGELDAVLTKYRGDVQLVAEQYEKDRRHVYRWLARHDLSAQSYQKR